MNEPVRNLIVCLDGTDNQFCATNTNVVRMLQSLAQDPERPLAYYDPGVGTIWEEGTLSKTAQRVQMILGLAFGLGVTRNVAQAYEFLMRYHRPDDRIFIFGFSRGALEARALAGLIHRCGLLYGHLPSLTPYALRLFQTPGEFPVIDEFKATCSRRVDIGFLGVWDTVTSMGNVGVALDPSGAACRFSGRPRTLRRGERVHRCAIQRFVARDDYRPATLTEAGMDADRARAFLATPAEEWIVGEETAALA